MGHWRATLPPARFVEVDYETLVAHPEAESRRLIAACGLEWRPQCLRPQDNARVIRSASGWQARQPVHAARWDDGGVTSRGSERCGSWRPTRTRSAVA